MNLHKSLIVRIISGLILVAMFGVVAFAILSGLWDANFSSYSELDGVAAECVVYIDSDHAVIIEDSAPLERSSLIADAFTTNPCIDPESDRVLYPGNWYDHELIEWCYRQSVTDGPQEFRFEVFLPALEKFRERIRPHPANAMVYREIVWREYKQYRFDQPSSDWQCTRL